MDNDIPGTLQFSSPTFSVNEDGTAVAAVTVTRTRGIAGAVWATVNLSNGTATAAVDYDSTPIVVNFAISNVGQDGIRLQGDNTNIENNDITNANIVLLG